jgi:hypothetical protein
MCVAAWRGECFKYSSPAAGFKCPCVLRESSLPNDRCSVSDFLGRETKVISS